jgi:hypothetical protein
MTVDMDNVMLVGQRGLGREEGAVAAVAAAAVEEDEKRGRGRGRGGVLLHE